MNKKDKGNYDAIIAGILDQEVPVVEEKVDVAVEETPTEEVPMEEVPAEEIPMEEVPAEEVPAEELAEEPAEEPAEEAPIEEVPEKEEPVEISDENPMDDLDSQIERELGIINKSQDVVKDVQTQVMNDDAIRNSKSFKSIQDKLKQVTDNLQDRETELEETQSQLKRYKKKLSEMSSEVADKSMSEITQKPILETLNNNETLKGAVLALNKARETGDESYTTEALNKMYDFIQKEANIDVRKLISQQQDLELGAMGAGESSAGVSIVNRGQDGSQARQIVDNILG